MKAVAPDPVIPVPGLGNRVAERFRGECMVESCIKGKYDGTIGKESGQSINGPDHPIGM